MGLLSLENNHTIIKTIQNRLHHAAAGSRDLTVSVENVNQISSVLLLLSRSCERREETTSPCIVMNLRSALVRQPGDVCCPGGGLSLPFDQITARIMTLPFTSLSQWPYWPWWCNHFPAETKHLALFYAAALREGFEEMRLNPFGVTFLGVLPPQHLVMFKRVIYPHVAWINRQVRFFPNWEVERLVYIPIQDLLNPANYARYRLRMTFGETSYPVRRHESDFLCYAHHHPGGTDILWGATFRITMDFLKIVFDFDPPQPMTLPVIEGRIDDAYLGKNENSADN